MIFYMYILLPIGTTCGALPRPRPLDETGTRFVAQRLTFEFLAPRERPLDDSDFCRTISI